MFARPAVSVSGGTAAVPGRTGRGSGCGTRSLCRSFSVPVRARQCGLPQFRILVDSSGRLPHLPFAALDMLRRRRLIISGFHFGFHAAAYLYDLLYIGDEFPAALFSEHGVFDLYADRSAVGIGKMRRPEQIAQQHIPVLQFKLHAGLIGFYHIFRRIGGGKPEMLAHADFQSAARKELCADGFFQCVNILLRNTAGAVQIDNQGAFPPAQRDMADAGHVKIILHLFVQFEIGKYFFYILFSGCMIRHNASDAFSVRRRLPAVRVSFLRQPASCPALFSVRQAAPPPVPSG